MNHTRTTSPKEGSCESLTTQIDERGNMNCLTVFNALEKWINQRSRADSRDYGFDPSGREAYRSEMRNIARDGREARTALMEARAIIPGDYAVLVDSFRAFSGRLEWHEAGTLPHASATEPCTVATLHYTTGQYFPTEYRKAARAVLETYVSAMKQKASAENPTTFTYQTMADVKAANKSIGNHWFDRGSMAFFNTKIVTSLIDGKYFVTSEFCDHSDGTREPTKFTVRMAEPDGTIDTVGEFQQYEKWADAMEAVRELVRGAK